MTYNEIITYNQEGFTYIGTVVLKIQGISNPIVLNNINIVYIDNIDYSTTTTIGVISVDVGPTGVITISATNEQASALIQMSGLTIHSGTLISVEF